MRSLLFVPADSERKLEKAQSAGADALIVDLEDSVAHSRKAKARKLAASFIAQWESPAPLYVRINGLMTGLADLDLAAVMPAQPSGIVLPKAEGGEQIAMLAAKLRVYEAENGIADGRTRILPIVTETAHSIFQMGTIPGASKRLAAIAWGIEDLSAAIGARSARNRKGDYTSVFAIARATTLLAASAAELPAIDTICTDLRDLNALRRDCAEAERDGFTGKLAIHPMQVPIINAVFTPSQEAIADARRIIRGFEEAGDAKTLEAGVAILDGKMIDRPRLLRAQRLLQRARRT